MAETYYAGIDGGQSSTTAIVADATGHILGRGTASAADEVGQDAASTRLRDALHDALAAATRAAGLPDTVRFAAVVAGISGYEGRVYGKPPDLPADRMQLMHDTAIAHAGAFNGEPGVVVIAGTGSAVYARNAHGAEILLGGWGHLFGDEGSAFGLVREAIAAAMRDLDNGDANSLGCTALDHFTCSSLRALSRAYYAGELSRERFADFARKMLELAERGDEPAEQLVGNGAAALARLTMRAARRVQLVRANVALTGGLMRDRTYRELVAKWLRDVLPDATCVEPRYEPVAGALLLAYKEGGLPAPVLAQAST